MRTRGAAALALLAACGRADARPPRACLVPHAAIRPLLVGDSARLTVGTFADHPFGPGRCDGRRLTPATWASADSAVARVTADGRVRAVRPGRFAVTAVAGGERLADEGFVLPPGWTQRILPAAATVRVGDTARFRVAAVDRAGRELPPVPFSLYTPEYLATYEAAAAGREPPADGRAPLTHNWSQQGVTGWGVFRAARPGTTTITGRVAGPDARAVHARLTVLPPDQ